MQQWHLLLVITKLNILAPSCLKSNDQVKQILQTFFFLRKVWNRRHMKPESKLSTTCTYLCIHQRMYVCLANMCAPE